MNTKLFLAFLLLSLLWCRVNAQVSSQNTEDHSTETAHSVLPLDGVLSYLPKDTAFLRKEPRSSADKVVFIPTVNFFFRPEGTFDYKEAGMAKDTGGLNFYLRGDFGGRLSLPKNIDVVFNLQSYGIYTRSLGPLDPNMSLYEAYVDMKQLDRNNKLSLRFGRMCLGKYGTEILVGDDDFTKGRSFESIRLRYHTKRLTSDLMWVQLYQAAPDSADFEWNHPIFLGYFNTLRFSESTNLDVNLPFVIDQYNSGLRTTVLMPNVRFFGQAGNLRYSIEGIYQTGSAKGIVTDNVDGKVNAYAMEASIGYQTEDKKMGLDVSFYRGSGDDKPGDDEIKSYNVLWQNEHRRFGYIDAFKGSNVQAGTLHLNWQVGRLVSTGVHGVFAQVLESNDRSAAVATIPNLNNLNTSSKAIGVGGDWYLNYYYNQFLNMQFSASVFSPGDYFTAVNGVDETMVRLYVILAARI
jgi:Alginate export